MKLLRQSRVLAGLVAWFGCVAPAWAADFISVDMDLVAPGIQSVRLATPGESFQIGLVMTVDAAGVSSYGISAFFDTAELSFTGPGAATNASPLPAGMFSLSAPVQSPPYAYTFNGATFGAGPTLTTFTFGYITYTVGTPTTDLIEDISVGFFNGGVDGFFDNSGSPVVPTFSGGFVNAVPEPGVVPILIGGLAIVWLLRRR
jgi:hypothetical protein